MERGVGGQLRLSVIVFLTLQHRVVVGGKLGPMHSHSCSVEVELSPPQGDTIPFAEMEAEIKAQITPLDGKPLNDLANFQGINPSIENFAAHLYNRLSLISAEYDAVLHSVIVRESPTRAVKYLREQANPMVNVGDEGGERKRAPVIRLPVGPNQNADMDSIRRLRSPVQELPMSPNQRSYMDFQPTDVPAILSAADAAMWAASEAAGQPVKTAEPVDKEDVNNGPSAPPPTAPVEQAPAAPTVPGVVVTARPAATGDSSPSAWIGGGLPSRQDRKNRGGKGKAAPAAYLPERDSRPNSSSR